MHIAEGIITGAPAAAYTVVGAALVGAGAVRMKKFVKEYPERKPLLGMAGAIVFFISLIPIPAFTGTCTHPCGTPLIAILFGPLIGTALAGVSLLLQAAFFAHGGFSTWGANVLDLGLIGSLFGWGTFKIARKLGLPLWLAGGLGGLMGDLAVYAAAGGILGTTLAMGPNPQYTLSGYLAAIYAAYAPTQLPIAVGEMVVTGLALRYAYKQRPEVLIELGIVKQGNKAKSLAQAGITALLILGLAVSLLFVLTSTARSETDAPSATVAAEEDSGVMGMDEAVNERFAEEGGLPAKEPYINLEKMGDVWNMALMLAGAVCGFVVGRWWHLLFDKENKKPKATDAGRVLQCQ